MKMPFTTSLACQQEILVNRSLLCQYMGVAFIDLHAASKEYMILRISQSQTGG